MSDRRGLYKNADRDFVSSRRNRQDHSVEIRKVKKEDHLQKRRNIQVDDLNDNSPVKENIKPQNHLSVREICKMMKSGLKEERLEAVTSCRKQLSRQRNPPIEQFFINGAIPVLVDIMRTSQDATLLFEAAWALTNISSGESRHTAAVVSAGAVSLFVGLIEHHSNQVAEQSVWALSNIAGDSGKDRDLIVTEGIVPVILRAIHRFWDDLEVLRHFSWFISNICRHKSEEYPVSAILELLPIIYKLMTTKDDKQVLTDLSWALSYATDSNSTIVDFVIQHGFMLLVNKQLLSAVNDIVAPSIRVMGNVVAGTDEQAAFAISAGVIMSMKSLLSIDSPPRIVKECCWLLSNVSAGTEEQVMALVHSEAVINILGVLESGDYKSQKEAVWVISNLVTCKKDDPKLYLLNNGVFARLVPLLSCDDSKVIMLILDCIKALFDISDTYNQLEQCINVFEAAGGIEVIEELQNHSSDEVYEMSYELVKAYFGDDEENEAEDQHAQNFEF